MALRIAGPVVALIALCGFSAHADTFSDLSFTLDSTSGSGYAGTNTPDPNTCLQPGCVLFAGTLIDNDTDGSFLTLNDIGVVFSLSPLSGSLSIDNSFFNDVPGVLIGDSSSTFPTYNYLGPIFGIDIAPGTTPGIYHGTVTITAAGGTNDPTNAGFTVSQNITVEVAAPEPASLLLCSAGLFLLAAYRQRVSHSVSKR